MSVADQYGPTVAQAAYEIGRFPEQLYRAIYSRTLRAKRIDGKWRIERASLRAYAARIALARKSRVNIGVEAAEAT